MTTTVLKLLSVNSNHIEVLLKRQFAKQMSSANNENVGNFVRDGKKILGAALNYMDIVRSRNVPVPPVPLLFLKPTSSYIVEGENIVIPKAFTKVAHEVELGCIIGRTCKNVSKEDAMQYVGGYCLGLDLTAQCELGVARSKGHPWSLGKGFDTSTPVSPLISLSVIKDPHDLKLWLKLNGEMKQQGSTADLIFKLNDLISYASKYMTLEPNDLILSGTPDGASVIKSGDIIECGLGDHKGNNLLEMKFNVCAE